MLGENIYAVELFARVNDLPCTEYAEYLNALHQVDFPAPSNTVHQVRALCDNAVHQVRALDVNAVHQVDLLHQVKLLGESI